MATLFISDLHLQGEHSVADGLCRQFLAGPATAADALYILGDLFEAWLGDDLVLQEYWPIMEQLRRLTDSGVPVYLMHGNRDFLIGDAFCRETGCTLLDDPAVIDLYGQPTLLMHGDLLCTDDLPYQAMRRKIRDPRWLADFLSRPPEQRIAFARELRQTSQVATREKQEALMDVNADTVASYLHTHRVTRLIHGHTHRPGIHRLPTGQQRIVLGAWESEGSVLRCDADGCQLTSFS